jgi:2-(3-amino-3-carboxypropyl)histidine synthase
MDIDLELERVAAFIMSEKAKRVIIQLPDGLKPRAAEISDYLEDKTKAQVFIWQSSCYGACDTPDVDGFDLLVQFGHSEWGKK